MRLDKSRFTASRGQEPSGFGLWIFEHVYSHTRFEFTGTYEEAVGALRRHADELLSPDTRNVWWLLP